MSLPFEDSAVLSLAAKGLLLSVLGLGTVAALRRTSAALRHWVLTLTVVGLIALPLLAPLTAGWGLELPRVEWSSLAQARPAAPMPDDRWDDPMIGAGEAPAVAVLAAEELIAEPSPTSTAPRTTGDRAVAASRPVVDRPLQESTSPSRPWHWPSVAWVWLVGVVVFSVTPLLGLWHLVGLRRRADRMNDRQWLTERDEVFGELGIARRVDLLISEDAKMPLTWGLRRPVLLLPRDACRWNRQQRRMVLLHEGAHIRRRDWWTQLAGQWACAIHWWNPAVWWNAAAMRRLREVACDDCVVAAGVPADEYADVLVRLASKLRRPSVAVPMARRRALEMRIRNILAERDRRTALPAASTLVTAVICLAILLPVAAVQETAASADREPSTNSDDAVSDARIASAKPPAPRTTGPSSQDTADNDRPAPRPAADDDSAGAVTVMGRRQQWAMPGGVTAAVDSRVFHGADSMTTVVFRWPATDNRPALRYQAHVAADAFGNRDRWTVVWQKGTRRVWLANTGLGRRIPHVRVVDVTDPFAVMTWSCGTPRKDPRAKRPQGIPDTIRKALTEGLPSIVTVKDEDAAFGDGVRSAASTDAEWTIGGTVTNHAGRPLKGVLVEAFEGAWPRRRITGARTDNDGHYAISFRRDLTALAKDRGLVVVPRLAGTFEAGFARSGEFSMTLDADERLEEPFGSKMAQLGQEALADFSMHPAVGLHGTLLRSDGRPWPNGRVVVRFPGQREGDALETAPVNTRGEFRLVRVPASKPVQVTVLDSNDRERGETIDPFVVEGSAGFDRLTLQQRGPIWRVDLGYRKGAKAPVRVRVVALQDELDPPSDEKAFAEKVVAWAESCRINQSAAVLQRNARVWDDVLAWHSLIHVVFAEPREARIVDSSGETESVAIDEIAFAMNLTGPGGIFLRSGTQTICLIHWTLETFVPVIREPALMADKIDWFKRMLDATSPDAVETPKTAIVRLADARKFHFDGRLVALNELIPALTKAGHSADATTVVLEADVSVRVTDFHWPLWQLRTSRWNHLRIRIDEED